MRRNPFNRVSDKFKIKPHISSNTAKDEVAKKLLWAYIGYWGTFLLWLIVSWNFIPMIFLLGSVMWILGSITAMRIPGEAAKIGHKTRFTMLSYIAGLLAWRMIIGIIVNTPVELWETALMMPLPAAFASSFLGFVSMAFVVGMFMGFVGYISYIFQLFMFHRASKKTGDYMNKLMRREEGDK